MNAAERYRRDAAVVASRASGLTLKAVGEIYGLSRERVRGIIAHAERLAEWTAAKHRMRLSAATIEDLPLECVELSIRTYNGLRNLDCATVGDAARLTENQLNRQENFGQRSRLELKTRLQELLGTKP